MKKEVILVPKDKCPLDVLAELGEKTRHSWIFFHQNVMEKLVSMPDKSFIADSDTVDFCWEATKDYPETRLITSGEPFVNSQWYTVYRIIAEDIAFSAPNCDPEDMFFLKMAE